MNHESCPQGPVAIIGVLQDSVAVRTVPGKAFDLEQLLLVQQDVLSAGQAAVFFTRASVRHRLRSGRWERPARGVYIVRARSGSVSQRRWVALLAAPSGAVLAGRTALELHGLRGLDTSVVHLLIPRKSRSGDPPPGVAHHLTRHLPIAHVQDRRPPRTTAARALLDAAQWARSDSEARTIIAAAFQQRLVTIAHVRPMLVEMTMLARRPVIVAAINDAAAGAHSLPEMEFLALCRRGGLPTPSLQRRRKDVHGQQWAVDASFDDYRVLVEIDGSHHLDVRQWWADMQRQNALWTAGERILRFPSWTIRHQPEEVIAAVAAALRAAGWKG
jgi:hypothetical protein